MILLLDEAMSNQPIETIGENIINVFFLPKVPAINPPKGVKMIPQVKAKAANQDPSLSFNSRFGRAMVANPLRIPSRIVTMDTVKAPIISVNKL